MQFFKIFLLTSWSLGSIASTNIDKQDVINGVNLKTGKDDDIRIYSGTINKTFEYPLETVVKGIINFDEKCNNNLKSKREFSNKEVPCKYHNDNVVESFIVRDINQNGWSKEAGEVDRFLVGRKVYNRGNYYFYDMIQVFESVNQNNQKIVTIKQTMLDTKASKLYTSPKFEKSSAFDNTNATFTLTAISPKQTQVSYEYKASTTHWVLNKEISVPQVFSSMSKSINDLFKTIDAETITQSREVASN